MTARLVIIVEVDADPTDTDPETVAEDLVDTYEIDRSHATAPVFPEITFVSAKWKK